MSDAIKVVCRFRPILQLEQGQKMIIDSINENQVKIGSNLMVKNFNYDMVFSPECSQDHVFTKIAPDMLSNMFDGYNCTLFTYGQSGSGKTFTLQGDLTDPLQYGLIPRTIKQIFETIQEQDKRKYQISVSFLECYMERLQDLIRQSRSDLVIKESKTRGIYIEHLTEVGCQSYEEAMRFYLLGISNRTVGATKLNLQSSRSHSLFLLQTDSENLDGTDRRSTKFWMVDLAGSEKLSKTEAEGLRMEEAKNINTSLTTLGMVIMKLSSSKQAHVPFRDSKLTRLLQESLGGNAKTVLCVCCSPAQINYEETVSTLNFGARAKMIKNKAKINKQFSVAELLKLLEEANRKIESLELVIQGLKGGKGLDNEMQQVQSSVQLVNDLRQQLELVQLENQQLIQDIQDLKQEKKTNQEIINQFNEEKSKLDEYKEEIEDLKQQIKVIQQLSGAQIQQMYNNDDDDAMYEESSTSHVSEQTMTSENKEVTPANHINIEPEAIKTTDQIFGNLLQNTISQLNQNLQKSQKEGIVDQFISDYYSYQKMIQVDQETETLYAGVDKGVQISITTAETDSQYQSNEFQLENAAQTESNLINTYQQTDDVCIIDKQDNELLNRHKNIILIDHTSQTEAEADTLNQATQTEIGVVEQEIQTIANNKTQESQTADGFVINQQQHDQLVALNNKRYRDSTTQIDISHLERSSQTICYENDNANQQSQTDQQELVDGYVQTQQINIVDDVRYEQLKMAETKEFVDKSVQHLNNVQFSCSQTDFLCNSVQQQTEIVETRDNEAETDSICIISNEDQQTLNEIKSVQYCNVQVQTAFQQENQTVQTCQNDFLDTADQQTTAVNIVSDDQFHKLQKLEELKYEDKQVQNTVDVVQQDTQTILYSYTDTSTQHDVISTLVDQSSQAVIEYIEKEAQTSRYQCTQESSAQTVVKISFEKSVQFSVETSTTKTQTRHQFVDQRVYNNKVGEMLVMVNNINKGKTEAIMNLQEQINTLEMHKLVHWNKITCEKQVKQYALDLESKNIIIQQQLNVTIVRLNSIEKEYTEVKTDYQKLLVEFNKKERQNEDQINRYDLVVEQLKQQVASLRQLQLQNADNNYKQEQPGNNDIQTILMKYQELQSHILIQQQQYEAEIQCNQQIIAELTQTVASINSK